MFSFIKQKRVARKRPYLRINQSLPLLRRPHLHTQHLMGPLRDVMPRPHPQSADRAQAGSMQMMMVSILSFTLENNIHHFTKHVASGFPIRFSSIKVERSVRSNRSGT